ncbi:putative nuclease HARBI1 [Amphiura filiformis]|uniref:putative nuclease HARBI1 n=1 Tax=Amphiura filiformis TaxID=82378 RepID=UPI003B2209AB
MAKWSEAWDGGSSDHSTRVFDVAGFPQVVSAVDCTHVLMKGAKYGDNAYAYVDRNRNKSINVQLMCNSAFRITNVVARWPGSSHDSRILRHSTIGQEFDAGRRDGILIGDGGYGLKPWLLTPISQPRTPAEYAYNRAHPRTRVFIEQVNGQIKSKFMCLKIGIRSSPKEACRTIVACTVLFNIAKELQEPFIIDDNLLQIHQLKISRVNLLQMV